MEGPLLKLHHGRDRMVAGFTTTCAISAHYHLSCEFEPCLWQGVLDTTLCDNVWSGIRPVSGYLGAPWFPPLI